MFELGSRRFPVERLSRAGGVRGGRRARACDREGRGGSAQDTRRFQWRAVVGGVGSHSGGSIGGRIPLGQAKASFSPRVSSRLPQAVALRLVSIEILGAGPYLGPATSTPIV